MSYQEQISSMGIPGLRVVREILGVTIDYVASQAGVSARWIIAVEGGSRDCSQALQRQISSALCCTPADLISPPDTQRLLQIRAAYLRRQADEAQLAAEQAADQEVA